MPTTNEQRALLRGISQSSQGVVTGVKFIAVQGGKEEPVTLSTTQMATFINTSGQVIARANRVLITTTPQTIDFVTPASGVLFTPTVTPYADGGVGINDLLNISNHEFEIYLNTVPAYINYTITD